MPISWDFLYEQKKKKDHNPLQQAYVNIEQLPFIPQKEEKLLENSTTIDLTIEKE